MKKKISLFILCGIVLLGVCGCVFEKETDGSVDTTYNCSILNNVNMTINNYDGNIYAITNDGKLYEFGNYSDGTNCKKVDSNLKFTKIINDNLVDDQNKLYKIYQREIKKVESYNDDYKRFIDDINIIKTHRINIDESNGKNIYAVLKNDGIIYLDNNETYISFNNEKILDFSQENDNFITWIKTNKAYYIRRVKDKKCNEYDDIECEYEFQKDEELTKQYDEISFIKWCSNKTKCDYVLKNGRVIQ